MAFTTNAPRTTPTTPARFGLTVDQLQLMQARCPGITLPPEFHSEWGTAVTSDERAERMLVAELGLIDQGLLRASAAAPAGSADVDPDPADDFSARMHPAVLGFLGLFTEPALLMAVHSWGGGRTIVQTIAVRAGFAASLVRGQRLDDHGSHPVNEDAVELSAFPVTALITETLRSLVRLEPHGTPAQPAPSPAGVAVLPLTLAQGLIGAIRTGDPEIIHAAALKVGLPRAEPVVGRAAFGIDAGYSLVAASLTGDTLAVHWFRSPGGWFELSADTPLVGQIESSIDFVDSSRVRIATTSPAAIVGQVTTAIGSLVGVLRG
ncbi:hypothetical protein [Cryobacterium arcticum]|uniref:ESX secretion-associated protein EspG n=1 Tax=Cryobacterium arcticum TaxID=670052 RepID=A0A317ZSE2_9MICO|nr:hypothetical protein [Cryobacterium arcticum]PXA68688.1 hypothetical protein CTB96_19090 [Cryobacterium arcticum]